MAEPAAEDFRQVLKKSGRGLGSEYGKEWSVQRDVWWKGCSRIIGLRNRKLVCR